MISRLFLYLLLSYLTVQLSESSDRGRKLFGGYRIEPKKCLPTTGKTRANHTSICMFNYECSRNNGEVVGTCMDGFLFGACCQLPSNFSTERPILSMSLDDFNTETTLFSDDATSAPFVNDLEDEQSFINQHSILDSNNDFENKETIDTVLRPDAVFQILDPVDQLTGFFSQSFAPSNFSGADTDLIDKNGTLIEDKYDLDLLLKATNRSTLSPDYFQTTESSTRMEPVKYVNTQMFEDLTTTAEDLVRVSTINLDSQFGTKKDDDDDFNREEIAINHIISILNASTPYGPSPTRYTFSTSKEGSTVVDSWVKVEETSQPTRDVTFPYTYFKPVMEPANFYYYDTKSSTKGISSSTSTSTTTTSTTTTTKEYTKQPNVILSTGSSTYPSSFGSSVVSNSYTYPTKQTTLQPAPTLIVLGPFGTSDFTSVPTSKPILVKKPTTPAIKPSAISKKPSVGTTITHNINTVISTDDAATATGSNIISTSFINVKLQDSSTSANDVATQVVTKKPNVWTTLSAWSSNKPTFQVKPNKPEFDWPEENLTPVQTFFQPTKRPLTTSTGSKDCDEETANPDELSNFPPDRNPNLTNSTPVLQQEKPTIVETFNKTDYQDVEIVSESDISTPVFVEDDVLHTKVNEFVNKIVDSLQDNFQDLKDVVYGKRNVTVPSTVATKKPTKVKPSTTTKKPVTRKPTTLRPVSASSKPTRVTKVPTRPTVSNFVSQSVSTRRPTSSVSYRPKPTKKVATTAKPTTTTARITVTETIKEEEEEEEVEVESNEIPTKAPDFRTECGVRPLVRNGRIVGGKGADFGEWPWQVLVREATWLGLFTKNKCGGVLINEKYVITAAHCQPGFLASLVAVFGEYDISGDLERKRSITKNVKRVIVHRGYNPASFENDIALLELESPVKYEEHIVPICLPEDNNDYTGRMATVTGWGRVKYNGGVPSILQEVQVPVMENAVCQEMYMTVGQPKIIRDSFLCAGYSNGQKDSCEGDSGGPLMIERQDGRWVLIGTVSHGIKCADPYLPGVYMRTSYFKPWLQSVTKG